MNLYVDTVDESRKATINKRCETLFGIPQCTTHLKKTTEWTTFFSNIGFSLVKKKNSSRTIKKNSYK